MNTDHLQATCNYSVCLFINLSDGRRQAYDVCTYNGHCCRQKEAFVLRKMPIKTFDLHFLWMEKRRDDDHFFLDRPLFTYLYFVLVTVNIKGCC